MFSPNIKTHLTPWTEVVGTLKEIFADDLFIYVKIDGQLLSFASESRESEIIIAKLKPLMGRKIGILKTDSADNPFCIRLIK